MTNYSWKTIYKVGISELDDQHKKLIDILNELAHLLDQENNDTILKKSLDDLIEYTNYHFDSEEKHFTKYDYPFINNHLKEHKELRDKILDLKAKFQLDKQIAINELSKFTKYLQVKHMMLSGKKFGLYLTRKTNISF